MMAMHISIININSASMLPLGHIAGTAAAVVGMVPVAVGSLLGLLVDRQFDGTITPLALAFFVASVITVVATRHAIATTR